MVHPHKEAIANMRSSDLISMIEESKMIYVKENLSIHLHEGQIKLLKQVRKHQKPRHKKSRIRKFEKANKDDLFNMHLKLYLKKYQKLAKKGLIEIDEAPENGLAYDCILTDYGFEILDEIALLESDWEDVVKINEGNLDVLKKFALNAHEITYNYKKNREFIF